MKILKTITEDTKCDWCQEEFEESELEETRIGKLCETCIRGIETRGENIRD